MAAERLYTLQLVVRAPTTTSENEISNAVNEALDEPPCDWGNWTVSSAEVISVELA